MCFLRGIDLKSYAWFFLSCHWVVSVWRCWLQWWDINLHSPRPIQWSFSFCEVFQRAEVLNSDELQFISSLTVRALSNPYKRSPSFSRAWQLSTVFSSRCFVLLALTYRSITYEDFFFFLPMVWDKGYRSTFVQEYPAVLVLYTGQTVVPTELLWTFS